MKEQADLVRLNCYCCEFTPNVTVCLHVVCFGIIVNSIFAKQPFESGISLFKEVQFLVDANAREILLVVPTYRIFSCNQ